VSQNGLSHLTSDVPVSLSPPDAAVKTTDQPLNSPATLVPRAHAGKLLRPLVMCFAYVLGTVGSVWL